MQLYKVKSGKHYFRGNKLQFVIPQNTITTILISLSIFYGSWLLALAGLITFICFYSLAQGEVTLSPMRACFSENCLYKLTDNFDQVNKLYGFSEGFHHWNSARIGWRCTDGENIELLAYAYVNGKRIIKPMIKIKPNQWIFCCIQKKLSKYVFKTTCPNGPCITVSIDFDQKWSIYGLFKLFIYRLYPYFGGKISAPKDMDIYLEKLTIE